MPRRKIITSREITSYVAIVLLAAVATSRAADPTTRIDPNNPPKGVIADDWYAVIFQGKKAGHMHSTVTRTPDAELGRDVIQTVTEMTLSLGRADRSITIGTVEKSTETLDGRIVRFSSTTDMSLMSMEVRGFVRDGRVHVTQKQLGQSMTNVYPLPEGAVMSWGAYRLQHKYKLKAGTKFVVPMYVPAMAPDATTDTTFEVIGRETVDLFGRPVQAWKVRQMMTAKTPLGSMNVESLSWVDDQYIPLVLEMNVAGQPIRVLQCDKAIALQKADPPELMAQTLIQAEVPARAMDATSVTYRLTRKGSTPNTSLSAIPDTTMQSVERTDARSALITVTRSRAARKAAPTSQPTSKELAALTKATAFLNIDDPVIRKLAKQAADGETDRWKLAKRLRAFVSEYIEAKDLGVGFATASEVARSKQGDCSEHAVLLAALARACGLPSRGVSGVVYAPAFGDRRSVFVWHMWTQVYLDGRWVDLDAALREDDVDPTHIALGIVPLSDAGLTEIAMPIWNLVGGIDIEVVAIDGKPIGKDKAD
jgi:hypothetical protein